MGWWLRGKKKEMMGAEGTTAHATHATHATHAGARPSIPHTAKRFAQPRHLHCVDRVVEEDDRQQDGEKLPHCLDRREDERPCRIRKVVRNSGEDEPN